MFVLFVFVDCLAEYVGRLVAVDRYMRILSSNPDYVRFFRARKQRGTGLRTGSGAGFSRGLSV